MTVRIAQLKVYPVKGDLQANHTTLMSVLAQVADEAPDVVVTPECFLDGYVATEEWVDGDSICRYAVDPEQSPMVKQVRAWAAARGTWFVLGCTRLVPGGACNTALVIDRTIASSSTILPISGNIELTGIPLSPYRLNSKGLAITLPLLLNCVRSTFTGMGWPCSCLSRGFGSKESTCDTPPDI